MAQNESRLEASTLPQVSLGEFRSAYAAGKGSANTRVDAQRVVRTGGGGGGYVDDILKRLGFVESAVSDIQAQVSGLTATVQHLATKEDVGSLSGLTATVQHLATKAEVNSLKADLYKLETSIVKWIIGTVLTSAALAFAIAKFVN
jgi:hypothetical protein